MEEQNLSKLSVKDEDISVTSFPLYSIQMLLKIAKLRLIEYLKNLDNLWENQFIVIE